MTLRSPFIWLLLCYLSFAQWLQASTLVYDNPNVTFTQSNPQVSFTHFLQGVRYAVIAQSPEVQKKTDENGSVMLQHLATYLRSIGFTAVAITTDEIKDLYETTPSFCDIAWVRVEMEMVNRQFLTNVLMEFTACNNDYFRYISADTLYYDPFLLDKLYTVWQEFHNTPMRYDPEKRLQMPRNKTEWNEELLKKHFTNKPDDKLEGIYEKFIIGSPNKSKYRIAIVRNAQSDKYDAIYLGGATNAIDWEAGELAGSIYPTGTLNFFNVHWYKHNKQLDTEVYLSVDQSNMLYFNFAQEEETIYKFYKQFPRQGQQRKLLATGSGIAISSNGYIVTNNHVIQGGNLIEVQTLRGGKKVVYQAVVMINDEINDLAVLKIDDWNFTPLPDIPYAIKTAVSDVGEKVYTLGYPLASTMGESLKLTDGVISAQKGFKGDVSTYQVTVPVHPGNSGGPLFDTDGNLISIIKAKHSQAESATYAIKSRNMLNLIELLPDKLSFPESGSLNGKPLKEQVKMLEEFVFFIKVLE